MSEQTNMSKNKDKATDSKRVVSSWESPSAEPIQKLDDQVDGIFENARKKVADIKDSVARKKAERRKKHLEEQKQIAIQKLQSELQIKEWTEKERDKITEEREKLSSMSTNDLLAEIVLAIRGFYSRLEKLEELCVALDERIDDLETDIEDLEQEINRIKDDLQ